MPNLASERSSGTLECPRPLEVAPTTLATF